MSNLLDLSAKISLDTSSYDKGLSNSSSKMSGFGDKLKNGLQTAAKVGAAALTTVASAAAGVTTAIIKITKATGEHADEIDKQSQKLGLSKTAYQEWDYVLSQSGADISSMTTGIKTLTNKIADATSGGEDSIEMFKNLGISLEDLQSMSREDIFKATIKGLQSLDDNADRAALANKLLGKSAVELTPLFNQTADSTDALIEKAHEYGMVMSDEAVQAGVDMQDSLDTLTKTFDGVKNNLASEFIPSFTTVINGMTDLIAGKDGATEKISNGLGEIADKILEKTPELIDMVLPIIEGMASAIIDNAPDLLDAGGQVISDIIDHVPDAMEKIKEFLDTDSLPNLISNIVDTLIDNIPEIISAGVDLFSSLLNNITGIIDNLSGKIGPFLVSLIKEVLKKENIQKIVDGGVKLLMHLVDDVDTILDGLMDGIFALIDGLFDLLTDPKALAKLMLAGLKLGAKLIAGFLKSATGLSILEKIPVIGDIFKGFTGAIDSATDSIIGNIDNMIAQLDAQTTGAVYRSGTGNAGYGVTININGDVKAEDVANEVSNRLNGTMVSRGVA